MCCTYVQAFTVKKLIFSLEKKSLNKNKYDFIRIINKINKISYLLFLLIFIQYKIKKYIDNKMLIEIIKNLIF